MQICPHLEEKLLTSLLFSCHSCSFFKKSVCVQCACVHVYVIWIQVYVYVHVYVYACGGQELIQPSLYIPLSHTHI